jgi:hypothetical protein
MTEILPAGEVTGDASSASRLECELRNLREKCADVPVVDPFHSEASRIFFSRRRRNRQKNVQAKNLRKNSFSKIYQAELEQRYTTNI